MSLSKPAQRKVLLIDQNLTKQQLRAVVLRTRAIDVHTASDLTAAGRLCAAHSYDLVLLSAPENSQEAAALCHELKKSKPKQRIAFLVGAPQYVREAGQKPVAIHLMRTDAQPVEAPLGSNLVMDAIHAQPTQWQAMMRRLLAAG